MAERNHEPEEELSTLVVSGEGEYTVKLPGKDEVSKTITREEDNHHYLYTGAVEKWSASGSVNMRIE